MRFDDLLVERYGAFERHALSFDSPGLTVVYGPNEAGKSTCLRAIRDFLFRIPEGSAQIATYGASAARVSATMTTAAGARLAFRRRCGRGPTLADDAGRPHGDDVLSGLLGSTDRRRFTRLFGLDHDDLRKGGEELLRADGDFGRIIVEAGGGLRSLVGKLAAIDREIDDLFGPRKKESRAFYRALAAHEEADRALRASTLTSEAHERDLRRHEAAVREVGEVRGAKRQLGQAASSVRRAERVLPLLRRLDQIEAELLGHADVAGLPDDYARRCEAVLAEADEAAIRVNEATTRHEDAARRLADMVVDEALVAAEAEVRDLAERVAVVKAARGEAGRRAEELASAEAHLDQLRTLLDLGGDADLGSAMPSHAALTTVRELAERKAGLDAEVAGARQDVVRHTRAVTLALNTVAELEEDGRHEPFGVGAGTLATIPAALAAVERMVAEAGDAEAAATAVACDLGLPDAASAELIRCPGEEEVRAEIAVRDALALEVARLVAAKAHAEIERGAALAEVDSLRREGEVATQERLVASRRRRGEAWAAIRASYVGERPSPPEPERRAQAEALDLGTAEADWMADRRSAEAERAAALNQAQRRAAEAEAGIRANADAERRVRMQVEARDGALRDSFPEVFERDPRPSAMLAFAARRSRLAELSGRADEARRRSEDARAQLAPSLALLDIAERRAGVAVAPDQDVATRVLAVSAAITSHDRDHDEHRRQLQSLPSFREALAEEEARLARHEGELSSWSTAWEVATLAVGLPAGTSPSRGSEVAVRWAGARGDLRAVERLRAALSRAAEDEAALAAAVTRVGERRVVDLPRDAVAAGMMLMERWAANDEARVRRETFAPEVDDARRAVERCGERLGRSAEALALASAEAGLGDDRGALRAIAAKRRVHDDLRSERDRLVEALRAAGDGLTVPILRAEVGNLDVDEARAELVALDAESDRLDVRGEEAIAAELRAAATLRANEAAVPEGSLAATREGAVTDMHQALERHLELRLAKHLVEEAIRVVREERQDPLVREAGSLLARMTRGEFSGLAADVDEAGRPVVVGVRSGGRGTRHAAEMSDGTRDQLFLAFRLASLKAYCENAEPLPLVADDILVHFDDERSEATLEILSEFASTTQVLLFTHHRSVLRTAERLAGDGRAAVVVTGA